MRGDDPSQLLPGGECNRDAPCSPAIGLIALVTLVTGCVTETIEPDPLQADLVRSAELVVSRQGFYIPAGSSMAWRSEIIWHEGEEVVGATNLVEADVRAAIERELTRQGLQFVSSEVGSDYEIVVAVLMGDSERGAALQQIARIEPALVAASQGLDRGTLIVAINHAGSERILWRGAVQAFLAEGLSPEESALRLQAAIESLLSRLPHRAADLHE